MRRIFAVLLSASLALLLTGAAVPAYTITDLGAFDGFESRAADLNDRGDVLGTINPAWDDRAFRIVGGRTEIWGETDYYVRGRDLNNRGAALVAIETRRMPHSSRIALWSGTTRTVLNPPGTWADSGVLADSGNAAIVYGAVQNEHDTIALVQGTRIRKTHRFPGSLIWDTHITTAGLIAGTISTPNWDGYRAFVWDGNRVTLLPAGTRSRALTESGRLFVDGTAGVQAWYRGKLTRLAGPQYRLADANRSGTAVGEADLAQGQRGIVISHGRVTVLPTLGGTWSRAFLINDRGEVAGISETATGAWHAFRWSAGRLTDLGTLPQVTEQAVQSLAAINSRGQIFGQSQISPSQYTRATIWTPKR